ncbi:hypothetical protein PDESU_04617 [Pontiella desulfatans]|uniref:Uncharacterized protein n=1 Tax=Pontiella desulfatans TaxID=2750659 RepID=A0A6C2U8H8_PONDE|nr:DUF2490 domain-containing protein [Pontiella desulfatans]VGO16027.1 hypothetical protein PDESU_04617 [Pontiella desulfatans]
MKVIILRSIAIAAACGITIANAWDGRENAVWLEGGIKGALGETLDVKVIEQVRYQETDFDFYYRHSEVCLPWKFARGWSLAPAYRYVTITKNGSSTSMPSGHLNLCNTSALSGLDLISRLRIFFADLDGADDRTDFRPKLALIPAKGWTALKLKPYAENEMMINLDDGRFYLNRLTAGIKCAPAKHLALCAFIGQDLVENSAQSGWNERYNYGMVACMGF